MRFRTKLFFALLLPGCLLAFPVLGILFTFLIAIFTVEIPRAVLMAAGAQAILLIDANATKELMDLGFESAGRRDHPSYQKLREILQSIVRTGSDPDDTATLETPDEEIGDIFLIQPTDRPEIGRYLISLKYPEREGMFYDMSKYPAMMNGWKMVSADDDITEHPFGSDLCVYGPVKDANKQVISLLCYAAPGDVIATAQWTMFLSWFMVAGLILSVSAVIAFLVSWWINRPLAILHDGMEAVRAGNLETRLKEFKSKDEFASLISNFNQMTEALRHGKHVRRSIELAAEVQHYLFPEHPPSVSGWDVYGKAHFCDETGGDFYDYLALPGGQWVILLGDASGHGIGSALMMASVRAAARSIYRTGADDLAAATQELNRAILEDLAPGRFVTFFALHISPTSPEIRWTSAGHEPGMLYSCGQITYLKSTGIPLGIEHAADYDMTAPLRCNPGDVLLLYTDGAPDAFKSGSDRSSSRTVPFGRDNLACILKSLEPGLSAQNIHDRLWQAILAHTQPDKPNDDVTLLVIKRTT